MSDMERTGKDCLSILFLFKKKRVFNEGSSTKNKIKVMVPHAAGNKPVAVLPA